MDPRDDLLLAIGRLEGKVDSLLAQMVSHHEELERLDGRVRLLEQGKSWALGVAAAASAGFSYFFHNLGD
ncbi:MAG: hypothetical protein Unbinned5784contig1000_36 [Prokaryotic dsDNA virus sp.]|nr:MAG: hypothetical protein Unbinned5784contig1000_36 [Prokaryotic dsDNA virus sp.]|tara:strand:+ start:2330 stop:2539 length:210 start_codon:yes stop_codon:yes gene_type:complete